MTSHVLEENQQLKARKSKKQHIFQAQAETPAYASTEQLRGGELWTATSQFSVVTSTPDHS